MVDLYVYYFGTKQNKKGIWELLHIKNGSFLNAAVLAIQSDSCTAVTVGSAKHTFYFTESISIASNMRVYSAVKLSSEIIQETFNANTKCPLGAHSVLLVI